MKIVALYRTVCPWLPATAWLWAVVLVVLSPLIATADKKADLLKSIKDGNGLIVVHSKEATDSVLRAKEGEAGYDEIKEPTPTITHAGFADKIFRAFEQLLRTESGVALVDQILANPNKDNKVEIYPTERLTDSAEGCPINKRVDSLKTYSELCINTAKGGKAEANNVAGASVPGTGSGFRVFIHKDMDDFSMVVTLKPCPMFITLGHELIHGRRAQLGIFASHSKILDEKVAKLFPNLEESNTCIGLTSGIKHTVNNKEVIITETQLRKEGEAIGKEIYPTARVPNPPLTLLGERKSYSPENPTAKWDKTQSKYIIQKNYNPPPPK